MRGIVPPDPHGKASDVVCAVVYMPGRNRNRFPAGCVRVVNSEQAAIAAADPATDRYAARVAGPSKSSEGQMIYYLIEWLR